MTARNQVDSSKPAASVQADVPPTQLAVRRSNQFSLEHPNNKAGGLPYLHGTRA